MSLACNPSAPRSLAFDRFVLVPERQTLLSHGVPVRLGSRAFELLSALVSRPGQLLTKRELLSQVWPDAEVVEGNLKVLMTTLRRALGDDPESARYIATVTGRGYRFIAPVAADPEADTATSGAINSATRDAIGTAGGSPERERRLHNLPASLGRVVGRAESIGALSAELAQARLVSIVGAGGVGKSTVAIAVAERAIGAFRDGVWRVDLAPLRDGDSIEVAIAATLAAVQHPRESTSLRDPLRGGEWLLLLDNCDHRIEAVAQCAQRLLASVTGLKILVTSREPLQIAGERVQRLAGLRVPPRMERLDAAQAVCVPAIELFVERASASSEQFRFRDADVDGVAELCRRLDGLPLAIELAATRIGDFGIGELIRQLDHGFHRLTGRRAGPERHRSLSAMLDWSHKRLSPQECALLRAASMLGGDFEPADAALVADVPQAETAQSLRRLVAKSLVVADDDSDGDAEGDCDGHAKRPRYRLLETTRRYYRDHRAGS